MESANYITNRNLRRNLRAYWVLVFVVLAAMSYYSYFKFVELYTKTEAVNEYTSILSDLKGTLDTEKEEYETLRDDKKDMYLAMHNDVNAVLPVNEEYTELTRELDAFFVDELSTKSNPIFVSNLNYAQPKLDESGEYSFLPVTLTITCTKENFFKFLDYIENSGSLTDKGRLMDIQSIQVNLKEGATAAQKGQVSLNVTLHAYFQKPSVVVTTTS